MNDMIDRGMVVTFFPAPAPASCCDTSGGTSMCDCGVAEENVASATEGLHPNEVLMERVEALRQHFGERLRVEVANYASNEGIYQAIDNLNAALLASGKDFLVSPSNFYTFISTVTPLITVDERITFTRKIPDWQQLCASVERALQPV
ncbi:MAG: hypothetical protein JO352_25655 [Chloroflexi bacterium]|nr:hypothetical protein [Chloroflexota bacterium]MBV9597012.1 hypothetical protein [Chloroflexota bacterium]